MSPGDRIRAFCAKHGLTQAEADYLLGVVGEAVLVEREAVWGAAALWLELRAVELRGSHGAGALEQAAADIRARKE